MEKYITQNGIKYELRGEQYYPMLKFTEQKEHKIGKSGIGEISDAILFGTYQGKRNALNYSHFCGII